MRMRFIGPSNRGASGFDNRTENLFVWLLQLGFIALKHRPFILNLLQLLVVFSAARGNHWYTRCAQSLSTFGGPLEPLCCVPTRLIERASGRSVSRDNTRP